MFKYINRVNTGDFYIENEWRYSDGDNSVTVSRLRINLALPALRRNTLGQRCLKFACPYVLMDIRVDILLLSTSRFTVNMSILHAQYRHQRHLC